MKKLVRRCQYSKSLETTESVVLPSGDHAKALGVPRPSLS